MQAILTNMVARLNFYNKMPIIFLIIILIASISTMSKPDYNIILFLFGYLVWEKEVHFVVLF